MNKLSVLNFDEKISFEEGENILIVIENKVFLRRIMNLLLSDNYTDLLYIYDDIHQCMMKNEKYDFLSDVNFIDLNSSRNKTLILKQIKDIFSNEIKESGLKIISEINDLFLKIQLGYDLDIESDLSFKSEDILKNMNITLKEEHETIIESLLNYVKINRELKGVRFFIFHHLYLYLTQEEMSLFSSEMQKKDISFINFESFQDEKMDQIFAHKMILDESLCTLI